MSVRTSKTLAQSNLKSAEEVKDSELKNMAENVPGESCTTLKITESIEPTEIPPKVQKNLIGEDCKTVETDFSATLVKQTNVDFQEHVLKSGNVVTGESTDTTKERMEIFVPSGKILQSCEDNVSMKGHELTLPDAVITEKKTEGSNVLTEGNNLEITAPSIQLTFNSSSTDDSLKNVEILHEQVIGNEASNESCSQQKHSTDKTSVQDTERSDVYKTEDVQEKDKCENVFESKAYFQLLSVLSQNPVNYLSDSEEEEFKLVYVHTNKQSVMNTSMEGLSSQESDHLKVLQAYIDRCDVSKNDGSETKNTISVSTEALAIASEQQSTSVKPQSEKHAQGNATTNFNKDVDNVKSFDTLFESKVAQVPQLHFHEGQMTIPINQPSNIPISLIEQELRIHDDLYEITLDISGFTLKDMSLQVVKDTIWFYAKQENESDYGNDYREMSRMFKIPKRVIKTDLTASIISNNFLFINAPMIFPIE